MTTVQCPFCLFTSNVNQFLLYTKRGPSQKRYQCPDCHVIMYRYTLFSTLEKPLDLYALWVYETNKYDLTKRLKWDKIKSRLSAMNALANFWHAYKLARSSDRTSAFYTKSAEETIDKEYEQYVKDQRMKQLIRYGSNEYVIK